MTCHCYPHAGPVTDKARTKVQYETNCPQRTYFSCGSWGCFLGAWRLRFGHVSDQISVWSVCQCTSSDCLGSRSPHPTEYLEAQVPMGSVHPHACFLVSSLHMRLPSSILRALPNAGTLTHFSVWQATEPTPEEHPVVQWTPRLFAKASSIRYTGLVS